MATILQATHLSKQYRLGDVTVRALDNLSLSVEKGDFIAIMGPSGSGKSTLMHLLGGLDKGDGGEIVLDGQPLADLSDDQITVVRRQKIGFIFQFFNLLPTLTAAENVALPLLIDGKSIDSHVARIQELLALVGLGQRTEHKPHQLSGGQQQRVAIARALITTPAIVLADEPTGNLDSKSGQEILELLRRTCDETQQTIIMVTHDAKAASYADRIIYLKDGRIVHEMNEDMDGQEKRSTRTIRAVLSELTD
jgi:putative ABC transport system ATP-binding protein